MIRYSIGLLAIFAFASSPAFGGELDQEFTGKSNQTPKVVHAVPQAHATVATQQVAASTEMDRETPTQAWRHGWGGWGRGGWGHRGWGWGGWGYHGWGWGGWAYPRWGWGWGWGWPSYYSVGYYPYYAWPTYSYISYPVVSIGWSYPTWCW